MIIELTAHAIERYIERYAPGMPWGEAEAKVKELVEHMTKCNDEGVIIATGEAWKARDGTVFICKRDKKYARTGNLVVVSVWNPADSAKTSRYSGSGGALPDDVDEEEVISAYRRASGITPPEVITMLATTRARHDAAQVLEHFKLGNQVGRAKVERAARVMGLPFPPTRKNDPVQGKYVSIEAASEAVNGKRFSSYGLLCQWRDGILGLGPERDSVQFERVRVAAQAAANLFDVPLPVHPKEKKP